MAWSAGKHLKNLIGQFNQSFHSVRIRKQDYDDNRAFVELEGWCKEYRIIVQKSTGKMELYATPITCLMPIGIEFTALTTVQTTMRSA